MNIFDGGYDLHDIALSAWSLIGIFALLGYIFKKPVGWQNLWKVYFGLVVFVACAFLIFTGYSFISLSSSEGAAFIAIMYLVQIPYWFAIWAYAYKSQDIWAQNA